MTDIQYTLKRSNRKTVAIYIRDGLVEVRAPHKMPVANIDKFVETKERWIVEKLSYSRERLDKREGFSVDYDSKLLYRGGYYPIEARDRNLIGFDDEAECFYVPADLEPEHIKAFCVEIYKMLARRDIKERVGVFAEGMNLFPNGVKINSAKSRWGSCSSKGNLNFSWMLIMADDDVIDYVVVHELAHMVAMNHSPHFWSIVERHFPQYEECRERLKVLQHRLSEEDWG